MRRSGLPHGSFTAGHASTSPARGHLWLASRRRDRMFRFDAGTHRPAEYSIMVEPRAAGPTIGVYGGLPIAERVVDRFGRRFGYVGVACRRRDGQFEVASLRSGEFIVEPGLT